MITTIHASTEWRINGPVTALYAREADRDYDTCLGIVRPDPDTPGVWIWKAYRGTEARREHRAGSEAEAKQALANPLNLNA